MFDLTDLSSIYFLFVSASTVSTWFFKETRMLSDHGRHLKVSSLPRNQLFRFLDRKVPKEYFSHFYFTGFVFSGWLWATLMSYSYSDWRSLFLK